MGGRFKVILSLQVCTVWSASLSARRVGQDCRTYRKQDANMRRCVQFLPQP